MNFIKFTASNIARAFTTSVIETGLNNYMSNYKKQFNSFGLLLTKSGFGFKNHQFDGTSGVSGMKLKTFQTVLS